MKNLLIIVFLSYFATSINAQEIIKDIDGNTYQTIRIGSQHWMAENLKVTHYNDGTVIPLIMDEDKWSNLITGAYCLTEENPENYKNTYGILYNFYTLIDTRKLCPNDWHVPTASEWKILIAFLGGEKIAGGQMKDLDSNLWNVSIKNANNKSGFSALPAGGRGRLGNVEDVGNYATWWSSTSEDSEYAWHWGLYPNKNDIRFNPGHKASGFSVRCIKDN